MQIQYLKREAEWLKYIMAKMFQQKALLLSFDDALILRIYFNKYCQLNHSGNNIKS